MMASKVVNVPINSDSSRPMSSRLDESSSLSLWFESGRESTKAASEARIGRAKSRTTFSADPRISLTPNSDDLLSGVATHYPFSLCKDWQRRSWQTNGVKQLRSTDTRPMRLGIRGG